MDRELTQLKIKYIISELVLLLISIVVLFFQNGKNYFFFPTGYMKNLVKLRNS